MKFLIFTVSFVALSAWAQQAEMDKQSADTRFAQATTKPAEPQSVTVDFAACAPESKAIDEDFGRKIYVVVGKSGRECIFRWGAAVENPKHRGDELPYICAVPQAKGKVTFVAQNKYTGIDFAAIKQYCATVQTE
jgi:hypothetical protein